MESYFNKYQNHSASHKNKKTFIVTKLPEESPLKKDIRTSFEDAEKYLKVIPSMVIGRLIKGPRIDEDFKIVPHSIVGPATAIEELAAQKKNPNLSLKFSAKLSTSSTLPLVRKDDKIKRSNFESVDDHKLKSIYNQFQMRKNKNKEKTNDFLKTLPEHISNNLKCQEKSLKTFEDEEKKFQRLMKYLSRKSEKKVEDLLMNKVDTIRLRKEINSIMESKKPFEERYGAYNWNVSLRRPKNFTGTRHTIINLGSNYEPVWLSVKETIPENAEIVRKPHSKITEQFKTLSSEKFNYLMKTVENTHSVDLRQLENIKDLELEGKDLLQVEKEITDTLTGKKIVYKNEFLNSLTNNTQHLSSTPKANNIGQNTSMDFTKTNKNLTSPQNYATHYDAYEFYKRKRNSKSLDFKIM